jgi:Na+/H+-dicarboxylate symporter
VLSFFVQLIALILGIVALVQSKKAGRSNGFALAAIIISAVLMVIGAILAAIFIPIFIESINAATVCANDPNATVEVFGQQLSCQQLLEQSGRRAVGVSRECGSAS